MRIFPDWIKEYMDYTRHSEAPDVFHFWTAVSTLAGTLRRRVWIEQRYFQWTPNFYIFLVAPPGIVSKSTTTGIGMSLLAEVKGVNFGPDVVTWQALASSLANSKELVQSPTTPDLWYPMSCLTIAAKELGTFFNPQDREMVDVLVSIWDSPLGVFQKMTKTQGDDVIENPWLNIIGCTTPSWIQANMPEYMIGGGFTSRSLFIYAEKKRQFVAYPGDAINSDEFYAQRNNLIQDLKHIAKSCVGEYRRTAEATKWGVEWYEQHWTHRPEHMSSERYGGYIARKQTHIHKLAMILSAARRDELVIEKDELILSNELITALERDMSKVFSAVGGSTNIELIKELVVLTKVFKSVPQIEAWRRLMSQLPDHKAFQQLVNDCVAAGYVKLQQRDGQNYITYVGSPGDE